MLKFSGIQYTIFALFKKKPNICNSTRVIITPISVWDQYLLLCMVETYMYRKFLIYCFFFLPFLAIWWDNAMFLFLLGKDPPSFLFSPLDINPALLTSATPFFHWLWPLDAGPIPLMQEPSSGYHPSHL